ncbi:hypothetical protein CMUS01_11187 [Colletotrichum musicola]|uniref:Ecp2 effector protein domain-containing protein n=1 Tax=Colletotrichum musicola TaxID=2175873 RepID=A0A8H6JZJ3_9PEZI|nr:hypothetical protein CMUS01_11187 [Colletotrichum musicola]
MQLITAITILVAAIGSANAAAVERRSKGGPDPPRLEDLKNSPPRDDQKEGVICGPANLRPTLGLDNLSRSQITDSQYSYIYNQPGNAVQDAGPGRCTRISCAWKTGVYFCNDNKHRIEVSWKDIARYANDAAMVCGNGLHLPNEDGYDPYGNDFFNFKTAVETSAQKFSPDGWNVFIQGEDC